MHEFSFGLPGITGTEGKMAVGVTARRRRDRQAMVMKNRYTATG